MKILQQLIEIPSLSGDEQQIIHFIKQQLTDYGLKTNKVVGNLVCHVRGIDLNKALVFNAHVDTVPPGNISAWKFSPHAAKVIGNKIYGLGASDEKAGVASLMLLAKKLAKHKPVCDVWFHFVTKEELDGSGTKNVMSWFMKNKSQKYSDVAGVLVEPTGLNVVEVGHKGNVFIKLEIKGNSGHGSEPEKIKTNCVLEMSKALQIIEKLSYKWNKLYHHPILGNPTIGVGTSISAGSDKSPNKFADICTATLDVRTVPEMHDHTLDLIKQELEQFTVKVSNMYDPAPYGLTEKESSIVQAVKKLIPKVDIVTSKGSTDQCFFTQHKIPAVIFGPGKKDCIHKPNEYCYPEKVEKAQNILLDLVSLWASNT